MAVQPSQTAVDVGAALVDETDLQEAILEEAAATGEESGRTICGPETTFEPVSSSFGTVTLPACPRGSAGRLIHGGGGHSFTKPRHSIPDMANVLLGGVEASLVVGTRTSDLMLAPDPGDRDEAAKTFRDILGVKAETPEDVVEALEAGRINPVRARRTLRRRLPLLFRRVSTPLSVPRPLPTARPVEGLVAMAAQTPAKRVDDTLAALREVAISVFDLDLSTVNINIPQLLLGEVANALVLLAFLSVLGGTPTALIRR